MCAGTREGGKLAAAKNKANDPDFYKKIGSKGGKLGTTGGFASELVGKDGLTGAERSQIAGSRGGKISRRRAKE
jgi:general stress protein YciG